VTDQIAYKCIDNVAVELDRAAVCHSKHCHTPP
jgi:hypothetical protein